MRRLERTAWLGLATAHRRQVDDELADVVHRRDRGLKHPIDDFLFHYYNVRPSQLAQWHPGVGVVLADATEYEHESFYRVGDEGVAFDIAAFIARRGRTVETAHRLLSATTASAPRFGCFGMHEWAMVYRLQPGETRHPYLKLRFPPDELASIVEEVGCRCSHFDAYRFFTPPARPLNLFGPTRESQWELDQPGCLHVNMDLYKWAGKLSPAVPSDLLLDTFRLAREIRGVDMAASAYDLTDWGLEPIRVETAAGRAEYVSLQKGFAERAAPLRARLLEMIDSLTREGVACNPGGR